MFYFTLVLVPSDTQDVMAEVERLLKPFGETLERVPCDCQTGKRPVPCDLCDGVGELIDDTNWKNSKWFWWIAGGRYDGRVRNESPERMKRFGHLFYFPTGGLEMNYGSAMVESWPTKEETTKPLIRKAYEEFLKGNTVPVKDLPADLWCEAVVTPDGHWFERPRACHPPCPDARRNWELQVRAILRSHPGCLAVGCELQDCAVVLPMLAPRAGSTSASQTG